MPNWKKVIVSGSDASLNKLTVTNGITGSLLGTASTASYVNTLNQSVIITGSLAVGTSSLGASENTITLGARDNASEGGQIGFNAPGGTYASASFIDNWQNKARILKGNNTTSTGLIAQWDIHTTQMQLAGYTAASSFPGTATANLAVDSGGNVITVSTTGGTVFPYTGNAVITGSLTTTGIIYAQPNGGMYFQGGDDAALYDINISNHLGVYGVQDSTVGSIKLGSGGGIISGRSGSIGIGTVNPTSASLTVNGNVWATSFTGSLLGTASYASQALSSSFATTASYATRALSSSFATTASYALTSSYSLNPTVSGSINNVDYIDFNSSSSYSSATARLGWDSGEETLQLGLGGGNVTYSLGEQLYQNCFNAEATTLTKGQVVYISGSQGNTTAIKLANNSADPSSAGTLGFVAETITSGGTGWVITEGPLRKLNTAGLTAGSLLFLGATPGTYTQTVPTAPSHSVRLGYVQRVDNTVGSIYVKIDNGYELGELHDVIDSTTTSSYGDLFIKSGSVWINSKQLTGSYGLTGSLQATSFTGSLLGTASYASQALSSSFASTASYVTGSIFTNGNRALSASHALTASYILNAVSASYAATASTTTAINGTATYLPYFNTSNTLANTDISLSGSNYGISITTPRTKLMINNGDLSAYNNSGSGVNTIGAQIYVGNLAFQNANYYNSAPGIGAVYSPSTTVCGDLALYTYNNLPGNRLENMRLFHGGGVGIGTTVTSSYKLDVVGTSRFNGNMNITGSITVSGSTTHQIIGNTNLTTPATAGGTVNIVSLNNTPTLTFSQAGTAARLQITVIGGSQEQTHFKSNVNVGEFNWLNNSTNYLGRLTTNGNLLLPGSGSTTQPVDAGYRLDVSGSARIRGYANTSISSSLVVLGSGSSQPIFTVQGSQGELFSVTDSLSGSLFSVNDISGLPILEAFSDNTVLLGSYQAPALLTTNKVVLTASGNFTLSSLPTASYDGAFYDYTARSGSNARAGSIMAIWGNGGTVNFTETTTTDFGSTAGLNLAVFVSGANMILTGSASTAAWTIKTIIRSI